MTATDPTGYAPTGPLETAPPGPFTHPADRHTAFTAAMAGAELGTYDWRIINWLCELDDPTCRTMVSLIWRARSAAQQQTIPACPRCGTRAPDIAQTDDEGRHWHCTRCGCEWATP